MAPSHVFSAVCGVAYENCPVQRFFFFFLLVTTLCSPVVEIAGTVTLANNCCAVTESEVDLSTPEGDVKVVVVVVGGF